MAQATLPTSERLAQRCRNDGEFGLAARYWDGSLVLDLDGELLEFRLADGRISGAESPAEGPLVTIRAPKDVWDRMLADVPPPLYNDIIPAARFGLRIEGEMETFWQYYPAIRRLVDLLREEVR